MKIIAKYVLSFISALLISLIGIVIEAAELQNTVIVPVLSVLSIIPIILFLLNIILAKRYINKINQTKVADMQSYMLRHRKEAAEASGRLLKKLRRIRIFTSIYAIIIWLLAGCIAVLGGVLYDFGFYLYILFLLYSGIVFYAVYSRISKKEKIVLNETAITLSKENYPYIYSLAYRAAKQLGCNDDILIILSVDCNATIVRDNDRYLLQIGIVLLNAMSEDELFCVFLHEFSHISDKHRETAREDRYNSWISSQSENHSGWLAITIKLFAFFDVRYLFNHLTYKYAVSVEEETEADRDMSKFGDAASAASSLLKLKYYTMYLWESGNKDENSIYESEELAADYLENEIEKFKNAVSERHTYWDELVDKEILANNATHPTLKMRLETLGVSEVKTVEDNSSQEYRGEVRKALDYAEEKIYSERKASYSQDRKENFLDPAERILEWEKNGKPISAGNYADIISDLKQIGKNEEAEKLCDRVINELNENSTANAYFVKGCALLSRYDDSGLDLIYHAIEKNQNYLDEGLSVIGMFCCYTGREKELLEYRARAAKLAQKNKDEDSKACFLSKKDNLTKENLPEGMLEDILSYIRSVDCDIIQNIYLVRKTISETYFTSAFIIHFYGGTDAQRGEIMHKIFCYLDSYPIDWQFSLFDYFDCQDIKVEKIEGSLVYSKSVK